MDISNMITTVDSHTEGEPTRVVTGGVPHVPGKTMSEKKEWLKNNLDHLRRMLMWEPRGHRDMFGSIITSPVSSRAHVGVIFMDSEGYLDMCGHGSMGTVKVLLETGMIPMELRDGLCGVVLDTPAGEVEAGAVIKDQKVERVTIRNVPSFWYDRLSIPLPDMGEITVNIAYGGNYFALVHARELNIDLEPEAMDRIKATALLIRDKVNKAITIEHPLTGKKGRVDLVEIYSEEPEPRNVVVFGSGQVDRSPCGTGTCAKMALLYEQNRLAPGELYPYKSLFGTRFHGRIVGETLVGNQRAIIPEITGKAYITGIHQFIADRKDPFKDGFLPLS
jgi:proline racemase/trans-L-3-hydroxyproline dehydratase